MSAKPRNDESASHVPTVPGCELPAPSCLVAHEEFHAVREDVQAIRLAVCGDEKMGHRGLIRRQDSTDIEIAAVKSEVAGVKQEISRTRERVLGFVAGATFVGSGVGAAVGVALQFIMSGK